MIVVFAGGGTGGHVVPALAVAREVRRRGHQGVFIGTRAGMEAKLVPADGFDIRWIEIGGLQGAGWKKQLKTLLQLPSSVLESRRVLRELGCDVVFSMGGYVAAPVMMAAIASKVPIVVMEPNAMPGLTSRKMGRWVTKALLGFPEAEPFFRRGTTEVTGRPVRNEFFEVPPKQRGEQLTVLVTGGSQGSGTLNQVTQQAWPMFRDARIRVIHQAGAKPAAEIATAFGESGVDGRVVPFLDDLAAAFAEADLVVARSGGTVAELAAAGKPSILVPYPFATDGHQLRNAQAFERVGAARLVLDKDLTGERLFKEIMALTKSPDILETMAKAAKSLARPGAAERAAQVLEEVVAKK